MKRNMNTSNDEMSVIWKKDKLLKFSKESICQVVASGDGCGELSCRLCGASNHLQLITNNRLDETLRLYFGVQVPPEGVICESCIKCMKITEGFSALVHASFNKTVSEDSSEHIIRVLDGFSPDAKDSPVTKQKEILSLLKTKMILESSRKARNSKRKSVTNMDSKVVNKKRIIPCSVCGQKYPMIMPVDSVKMFICSRCQKYDKSRDCKKIITPLRVELRCKSNLKGNNRLNIVTKTPQQVKHTKSVTKCDHLAKHICSLCHKRYAKAENLATHNKTVHGGSTEFTCSLCGKKIKSKEFFDKHLTEHNKFASNFQCTDCNRVFRSKRALQSHYAFHDKRNNKSFSS